MMLDAAARAALRKPFPKEQIGKLPATQKRPALDYVGHAPVTQRLNEAAPDWTYSIERVEVRGTIQRDGDERRFVTDPDGLPHVIAVFGTMTIGGVSRQEVGEVDSFSTYGNELKNAISDFIRRGAMRFGVALDLWSKEDLTSESHNGGASTEIRTEGAGAQAPPPASAPSPPSGEESAEPKGDGEAPRDADSSPGNLLQQATELYGNEAKLVRAARMLWEVRSVADFDNAMLSELIAKKQAVSA
jgi:hypothetical protein